ncbi:MAG: nitroreductase family protein [Nanoarchaeota archaeon]
MDVMECIQTRRSVRRFADIPIEMRKIGDILEAGRLAPSAGNLQAWRFILIVDEDKRRKIAEACLQQSWIANAPVHIIIVADTDQSKTYYGERGTNLYSIQNTAAAIQNMLLATHAHGLSTCWVSAFEEGMLANLLSIPPTYHIHAVLPIGYADEKPLEPAKYKLDIIVFLEGFGNRIKDMKWVLGHYSFHLAKAITSGKKLIEKEYTKLKT